MLTRYSEPYTATGGIAAEGVLNQLGRPDIEPLEVLVRESVQNSWDAKRQEELRVRVDIVRTRFDDETLAELREQILPDPPPGLPLADALDEGVELLHFADFGTSGLGGPTRADEAPDGRVRDFVDFVRNMGQPPDKELAGGSFGYGKAAFYIASRARTVFIDTLCESHGQLERRFIVCALGENFDSGGRPFTGRHWWGRMVDRVPEPLRGEEAEQVARRLGFPDRNSRSGMGTTIGVLAPGLGVVDDAGDDRTMEFVAEALTWNFWPRMVSTPGGAKATIAFKVVDNGRPVQVPDPRTHPRLRGFVEAFEVLRSEPDGDDELILDRVIECLRPAQRLGRLVLQKGPVAPMPAPNRAVPEGARQTMEAVHHVALMRNAELVVKYLKGPESVTGRFGYSGVFRCAVDVDEAFRAAEPPTHDDWVFRFVPPGHQRTFVKVGLERIARVMREAAGYDAALGVADRAGEVPLGEFADALATLMPGLGGPGARRPANPRSRRTATKRGGKVATDGTTPVSQGWEDGGANVGEGSTDGSDAPSAGGGPPAGTAPSAKPPQIRRGGEPRPTLDDSGRPVLEFPFELRAFGGRVHLSATAEVMTNDGGQVESEPPAGYRAPEPSAWIDPDGTRHNKPRLTVDGATCDGAWVVQVPLSDEAMIRVNVEPSLAT